VSSRSSIFCDKGVHIFEEVLSEEICIELNGIYFGDGDPKLAKLNEKYGNITMPKESFIEMAKAILKAVDAGEGKTPIEEAIEELDKIEAEDEAYLNEDR